MDKKGERSMGGRGDGGGEGKEREGVEIQNDNTGSQPILPNLVIDPLKEPKP